MLCCFHDANDLCSPLFFTESAALDVCGSPGVASLLAGCLTTRSVLPPRLVSPRVSYFGKWLAGFQQASSTQEEMYNAYRQRQPQPQPQPQPPVTQIHAPLPPQPASYGSDYGSLDRSSMSGREAMSPVKRREVCDVCAHALPL